MPPRILHRRETVLSPWVTLVEKQVELASGGAPQTYHMLKQADYVGILARTPSGKIPVLRQYRPALEDYTWELPGGLLEPGESPADCCRRELLEETGLVAREVRHLGTHPAEVGRLENWHHMFFAEASEPGPSFVPEAGSTVAFLEETELEARIRQGQFTHPLHLALVLLYRLARSAQ